MVHGSSRTIPRVISPMWVQAHHRPVRWIKRCPGVGLIDHHRVRIWDRFNPLLAPGQIPTQYLLRRGGGGGLGHTCTLSRCHQEYSLVQWNWFSDVIGCLLLRCIQQRQRTNFIARGCRLYIGTRVCNSTHWGLTWRNFNSRSPKAIFSSKMYEHALNVERPSWNRAAMRMRRTWHRIDKAEPDHGRRKKGRSRP